MLKDLKNSRTLPTLQPTTVDSLDLTNYCLCNLSAVTLQFPKIILPSPSQLLNEKEVFYQLENPFENTNEFTPVDTISFQVVVDNQSFSSEYNKYYLIHEKKEQNFIH